MCLGGDAAPGVESGVEAMVQFAVPTGVTVSGANSVRVAVTIAEMTGTQTFLVGVIPDGGQDGLEYALGVSQVQVTLGGPLSALNAVNAAALAAQVDVSALSVGQSTAAIGFEPPDGLQVVSITPSDTTVVVSESPISSPGSTPHP